MQKMTIVWSILFVLLLVAQGGHAQDENATITDETTASATDTSEEMTPESITPPKEDALPAEEPNQAPSSKVGIAAAAKVGATFHTIFNELSPMMLLEIEAGALLLNRHLEVDLALAWARPKATESSEDARLSDGSYDWEIKQDFLSLGIIVRYRFLDSSSKFNVYGALGPRLLMLRTAAEGSSGGEGFGTNKQFETRFGGSVAVGGEFNIGPGAILLEVGLTFGELNGYITGDTSAAALDALLGYRFMFDL